MSFPYMNLKITQLLLLIGLFLASLNYFLLVAAAPVILTDLLQFIGLFLSGWALLSFAVTKQLNKDQKLIAIVFALIVLVGVFGLKILFSFKVAPYNDAATWSAW